MTHLVEGGTWFPKTVIIWIRYYEINNFTKLNSLVILGQLPKSKTSTSQWGHHDLPDPKSRGFSDFSEQWVVKIPFPLKYHQILRCWGEGHTYFLEMKPWGWRRPSLGMDWISWPIQKSAEAASRKREAYGTAMHMDIRCQWQTLPRGWVQQIQQCSPTNWLTHERNHSTNSGPSKIQYTYLARDTIWFFNIAMEHHHF